MTLTWVSPTGTDAMNPNKKITKYTMVCMSSGIVAVEANIAGMVQEIAILTDKLYILFLIIWSVIKCYGVNSVSYNFEMKYHEM